MAWGRALVARLGSVVVRIIRPEENRGIFLPNFRDLNHMSKQYQRGNGVGKGIMPAEVGMELLERCLQSQRLDEMAEGVGGQIGPESPAEFQRIHPGPKAMKREGSEKATFCRRTMGHHPVSLQETVDAGPQF